MPSQTSNTKPVVKIKDYFIDGRTGYYRLSGRVIDHPRFANGERVVTSPIIRVETKNTIYELED